MKGLLRLASFLALLAAFVMLIVDGTTVISARSFDFTSLGELVGRIGAPGTLDRWGAAVSRGLHPLVWGAVYVVVFGAPAVMVFAIFGLVCWMMGRRGEPDLDLKPRD